MLLARIGASRLELLARGMRAELGSDAAGPREARALRRRKRWLGPAGVVRKGAHAATVVRLRARVRYSNVLALVLYCVCGPITSRLVYYQSRGPKFLSAH